MINFENLDKRAFAGVGPYNIPQIAPVTEYPSGEFMPFNFSRNIRDVRDKNLHFFVDDYRFARLWNKPNDYIPLLSRFRSVCAPDFSTYTDMPVAMQIYNHYRKHWLAAYWQAHGLTVYPTISWSDRSCYDWCFDGEPVGGIVAVSSVGTQANAESNRLFLAGYEEMIKRLNPPFVIFYGKVPAECDWNVIRVEPNYQKIAERRGNRNADSGADRGVS